MVGSLQTLSYIHQLKSIILSDAIDKLPLQIGFVRAA